MLSSHQLTHRIERARTMIAGARTADRPAPEVTDLASAVSNLTDCVEALVERQTADDAAARQSAEAQE